MQEKAHGSWVPCSLIRQQGSSWTENACVRDTLTPVKQTRECTQLHTQGSPSPEIHTPAYEPPPFLTFLKLKQNSYNTNSARVKGKFDVIWYIHDAVPAPFLSGSQTFPHPRVKPHLPCSPPSGPWKPPICSLLSGVYLFRIFPIHGILQ